MNPVPPPAAPVVPRPAGAAVLREFVPRVALALMLLSGAVGAAQTAPASSAPAPARSPAGLIAYVDLDGRTAVVDPGGARAGAGDGAGLAEPLARYGEGLERAQFPVWSSDGNRIAVIVSDLAGGRVDVIDVARGAPAVTVYRRAGQAPIYLAWAPGDRTLAVLANAPGGLALDLVDVAAAVAGAGDATAAAAAILAFARGAPFYWTWARSGSALLVHQNVMRRDAQAGFTGIATYDVRTPLPNPGAFQSPALATSERYLAYAAIGPDGQRSVVAYPNPERPDPAAVARSLPHAGQAAFAWRPGRDQLAVQSPPVPSPHAFGPVDLLDAATGQVTRLSDDQVVASWWSPDGRWLATLSLVSGGGDRTAFGSLEDASVAVVATAVPTQRGTSLFSLKVIDADTLETRRLAAFTPSPLFASQYLPFFDQYARSHRLWSPASDALVLPAVDEFGVPTLVVFQVDGTATPLVQGDLPAWNVR